MNTPHIITELERNQTVFENLLKGISEEAYNWRPKPEKWNLLEIVCHLYDEEREDFRTRVRFVLDQKEGDPPAIDPEGWVAQREYTKWDYNETLDKLLAERAASIKWLRSLSNPDWQLFWEHPQYGPFTAGFLLSNWLAHDYLHIRQILYTKHRYLRNVSEVTLRYAGEW